MNRLVKRRLVGTVAAVGLTATALLMLATTASAGANGKRTTVSGDSTFSVDGCNNGKGAGAIELTGDLVGCLTFFPKRFTCQELNGFALYKEWGREKFNGTWKGKQGKFRTKYKIAATYKQGSCAAFNAEDPPFAGQITGGCKHKVFRGWGAFKGYRGLITFHDVIVPGSGASNFLYSGHLRPTGK